MCYKGWRYISLTHHKYLLYNTKQCKNFSTAWKVLSLPSKFCRPPMIHEKTLFLKKRVLVQSQNKWSGLPFSFWHKVHNSLSPSPIFWRKLLVAGRRCKNLKSKTKFWALGTFRAQSVGYFPINFLIQCSLCHFSPFGVGWSFFCDTKAWFTCTYDANANTMKYTCELPRCKRKRRHQKRKIFHFLGFAFHTCEPRKRKRNVKETRRFILIHHLGKRTWTVPACLTSLAFALDVWTSFAFASYVWTRFNYL